MISPSMLPQLCKIYRTVTDESKAFVTTIEAEVGQYPCYLSQKRQPVQLQLSTQTLVVCNMELLLNLPADIRPGDRVEIDGDSFTVGFVYKPLNRHIQADLFRKAEA